jgi:hypothetical protein
MDQAPERLARVRAGEIVVSPSGPQNPKRVPSGRIHHWVGAVFIPHATLKGLLQVTRDYVRYKELYEPTVIDSKVIAAGEAKDRFSMRLGNRSLLLKTALDTPIAPSQNNAWNTKCYSVAFVLSVQSHSVQSSAVMRQNLPGASERNADGEQKPGADSREHNPSRNSSRVPTRPVRYVSSIPCRFRRNRQTHGESLVVEHCRIHVMELWPDGPRKEAGLAAAAKGWPGRCRRNLVRVRLAPVWRRTVSGIPCTPPVHRHCGVPAGA